MNNIAKQAAELYRAAESASRGAQLGSTATVGRMAATLQASNNIAEAINRLAEAVEALTKQPVNLLVDNPAALIQGGIENILEGIRADG